MLEAMFAAEVGDDVYEEDPAVQALEHKIAAMFGKEKALFCPSGTMTNQIALNILTQPQDEVISYHGGHIYKYEGGGLFSNSGVSIRLLDAERGILKAQDIENNINPDDIHFPETKVVAIENTVNRGGGSIYRIADLKPIYEICQKYKLRLHLDGARLFNALVACGESALEHAQYFDTISICLSKGLGCPVGSVILADQVLIKKAKRVRKAFGGAMRQAGYLAAAGVYALDHHIVRLAEDHRRAKIIEDYFSRKEFISYVWPVETNIVIFRVEKKEILEKLLQHFATHQIKFSAIDKLQARIVTHLDFDDQMLDRFIEVADTFK